MDVNATHLAQPGPLPGRRASNRKGNPMMKRLVWVGLLALAPMDASAQQTRLTALFKARRATSRWYIESLAAMATAEPAQATARHYTECLTRSRVNARQLANYLREYVRARPELHDSSIQHAMNNYLNALCGQPSG